MHEQHSGRPLRCCNSVLLTALVVSWNEVGISWNLGIKCKVSEIMNQLLKPSITNSTSNQIPPSSTVFFMAGTNPPRCRCHGGSPKHLQCGTRPWGRSGCLKDAGKNQTAGTVGGVCFSWNVSNKKNCYGSISGKSSIIVWYWQFRRYSCMCIYTYINTYQHIDVSGYWPDGPIPSSHNVMTLSTIPTFFLFDLQVDPHWSCALTYSWSTIAERSTKPYPQEGERWSSWSASILSPFMDYTWFHFFEWRGCSWTFKIYHINT